VRYEERGPAVSGEAKKVRARKMILNCEASAIASNFSQLHRGYADLALELGYSDQAHFVRDFKAIVGVTPAVYARR